MQNLSRKGAIIAGLLVMSLGLLALWWPRSGGGRDEKIAGQERPAASVAAAAEVPWMVSRGDLGALSGHANPTSRPNDDLDDLPQAQPSHVPPVSAYGEIETIRQDERIDDASGVIERVRLVRADFKYPLLRVEESLVVDESDGTRKQVLVKRTVMVADHVLVSKPDEALRAREDFRILGELAPVSDAWRVSIPADRPEDLPEALAKLEGLAEVAEPDFLVFHQQSIPNDAIFNDLWGMRNIGQTGGTPGADVDATGAWQHETGSGEVIVAVIDSGVDYLHPDLAANIYQNSSETANGSDSDGNGYVDDVRGWDFHGNDNNPMDDHFHGTHVAGTVGARGNNNVGVAGVIWNVKIMPLKFLSANGSGTTSDAIAAVRYATDNGARISCNSWGGGGYSRLLEDAIRHAGDMNSLFVAAAGNSSINNDVSPSYPASYDLSNIIAVAATDHDDEIAWFSNYGATRVHIAAPGVGITSTFPRTVTGAMAASGLPANYARISGTSMATPHVAGAAALLLDSDPSQTTAQLRNRILQRADFLPGLNGLVSTSARLNVASLVDPSWVPTPAEPTFGRSEWREVSGQSDGDGVAGAGERIEFVADITNRGGNDANEVVLSAAIVSGPATLVSPAVEALGTLEAYAGLPQRTLAVIAVDEDAQDLEEIVVRLEIAWQGGGPASLEMTIPVTSLSQIQASREVDFSIGEMIRGPLPNKVFLLSPSAWRLIEVDTAAGEISRFADLDMSRLVNDEATRKTGGLATNPEGTLLYTALTDTRQIQVFSLPELAPLLTLSLDHQPYSLAVDARGRLFTTSMDYWGPLREVDTTDGRTIASRTISNTGRWVYQGAILKTDSTRERLFLAETNLQVTGGPGYVYEWDVSELTIGFPARHPCVTINLRDFDIDEQNQSLLTMHGGIYGVQVTSLTTGAYGEVWPLRSPYGSAVDVPPGKDHLFAASAGLYPGIIRRFQKGTGMDLGAYEVQPPSSGAWLPYRGLVATDNDRVLYASIIVTGGHSAGIDGVRYFLNLAGTTTFNVSLPPPTPFPPRPLLAKVDFSDLAGNGDSFPNPGELIHLAPHIRNIGGAPTAAGVMEIESLDARVTLTGTSEWDVPEIARQTTLMLPEVGVQIGASVPNDTAVDFLFRLTLSGGGIHEFRHRLTVRVPQVPAGTSPFTMSRLQFTGLAASPNLNEVYLVDSRYLRVVALDTTYGMIRRIEPIPIENRLVNGQLVKLGEPAVSPDGSLLAVAGNETNRVFVYSLPEIRLLASHTTTFRPTHVTFDSLNRLHVTGTNKPAGTTLRTLRMNAISGEDPIQYGLDVAGSPLRASKDGSLVGRRESGRLRIYDGAATGVPAKLYDILLPANELYDFEIDPVNGKAYLIVRDGKISVRNLADGVEAASWQLNNPNWGSAVRICPNGELVGASDYWYGGGVRRYSAEGATLQDVALTDYGNYSGGNAGGVIPRGLAVTPNNRVVFVARAPNSGGTSIHADNQDYTVGIIGVPIDLTEPGVDPLKLTSLALQDPSPGNNNGYAEPGEKIVLVPTLRNTGFSLLNNVVLSLVSSNPAVVPAAPLSASFSAVNSGVSFSTSASGLAANIGSGLQDGESLGLFLQISHSTGTQLIPLDLFASKTTRANAEITFAPGMLLTDTTGNRVHLTDKTNHRILSIDTSNGTVSASGRLAGSVGDGGIALSPDGGMLAAALTGSNRIQILATDTLASIDVLHLDFTPVSVAFGANGRIYATTSQTWSRVREIDPATGQVVWIGARDYYRNSRLKHSADHRRLYVHEAESGNSLDEYLVDGDTPVSSNRTHAYRASGMGELVVDEELRRLYLAMGGTNGVQVTDLDYGVTEGVWPLDSLHGMACAFLPGSAFVYAGSGAENGRIRRFERHSGRPLADYPLAVPGVLENFYLVDRGLAAVRNQRVVFATRTTPSPFIAGRHFISLVGHHSLNMTQPLARPKLDAGPDKSVKLSKPVNLQAQLEPSPGAGTPTIAWSKVSGPGTAVFSENSVTTTVNFSQPGRYRLQIRAEVNSVASIDAVWVDVAPDDPWINISPLSAKAMRHPGLQGGFVLSREGNASIPLNVQLLAGGTAVPGTAYHALPTSVVMAAGVSAVEIPLLLLPGHGAGTIDLTVSPGVGYEPGVASTANITIVAAEFSEWLDAAKDARPELDLSANGDPNGNGLPNLMEYLLGRSPFEASHGNPLEISGAANPAAFTASFRALKNPLGAALAVEFSGNLTAWNVNWEGAPAIEEVGRQDHGDGTETVTVRLSAAAATQPDAYLRLKGEESGD
jgi:subtilisin family serine protease/sugar lactone lactonase YvrE